MSINSKYTELLMHIGKTVSIKDFLTLQVGTALRHDIDYNLDLALEFGHLEHSLGYQSTYFLLDTADYWHEHNFEDKVLQLQDFGHEVGLHINSLAKWASGRSNNPEDDFKMNLKRLRDLGLNVSGISAHGDPDCYHYNVANYWMFLELRPENPHITENNITAEGIKDVTTSRTLTYPENDTITNANGEVLPLWQTSMANNGIHYHATHIDYDQYFSDSGGNWRKNLNPMDFSFDNKRNQILVHPEHWKGEKKVFFFLSTARSGSKWLSEVLDAGTSCNGAHEFTLNYDGSQSNDIKNTATNFQTIQQNDHLAEKLLIHSYEYIYNQPSDWAECNVYLPHLIDKLKDAFPNAKFVHLKRDTDKVVNSLINRNWYDTPIDPIHPIINFEHYGATSQVMRCALYVEKTKHKIETRTSMVLIQEKLVSDFEYFKTQMTALGIAVYPRLAKKVYHTIINKNKVETYASPSDWTNDMKKEYADGIQAFKSSPQKSNIQLTFNKINMITISKTNILSTSILNWLFSISPKYKFYCENVVLKTLSTSISGHTRNNLKHSYFSIGGSKWHKISKDAGFITDGSFYYGGNIDITCATENPISIFCIFYQDGQQIGKRSLYVGKAKHHDVKFAFTLMPGAQSFDIFVYITKSQKRTYFTLNNFHLYSEKYK